MKNTQLQWLGQSGFIMTLPSGKRLLIDPWQNAPPGNSLFPSGLVLDSFDYILITHGHLDHIGDSVELAKKLPQNGKIVSSFEVMLYLWEQGVSQDTLQAMNIGGTVELPELTVTMVPAIHSTGIGSFSPKSLQYGGYAAGYILQVRDGLTIYHAGDTDVFSDMKLIGDRFAPDIALLPIGDVFTMGPPGAVSALHFIHPKKVIPMHYGGTFALPGSPEVFSTLVKKEFGDTIEVLTPKPGDVLDFA